MTSPILALALGIVAQGAKGSEMHWNSSADTHFDGVNEFGFVSVWQSIGKVYAGDSITLPLNINFRSDRSASSSILGSGWHLSLLDSNIVQIDERTFMMSEPTGSFRFLWRDRRYPNILGGEGGWKAEIRGDTIIAWAGCGIRLVFDKGRIASMYIKDKVFNYNYKNGQISELREGTTLLVKVLRAPLTNEVTGLTLANNQNIKITHGERPRIQTVQGKNLVVGKDVSLASISTEEEPQNSRQFEYGVDGNLQPKITMKQASQADREIVWNAANKLIIKDGEWTYDIKPSEVLENNAAIGRRNAKGQSEFWHYNTVNGEEVTTDKRGATLVRRWFTSGILAGQTKEVSFSIRQESKTTQKHFFDELGRLRRTSFDDGKHKTVTSFFWSNSLEGATVQTVRDDCVIALESYDLRNRITKQLIFDLDEVVMYSYKDDSSRCIPTIERGALKFSLDN